MTNPDLIEVLDSLHADLKETLRMQTALGLILKTPDCTAQQIFADIIQARLGRMDLCLMFLKDLLNEGMAGKEAICQTSAGPSHRCVVQGHEIIVADETAGGV